MPYSCVHCSSIYSDGSKEILEGCAKCQSKFFFYITEEKLKKIKSTTSVELSSAEKEQVEKDVREIIGVEDQDAPVVLDFEGIEVIKPGKYLIDIRKLFANERPLVYKLEDGKYFVDLNAEMAKDEDI